MDVLNKVDDFIYKTLKNLLFNEIPEYQTTFKLENNLYNFSGRVYLFMNEFAAFLISEIEVNPHSAVVNKAFVFINQVGESDNLEILNILKIGILEILYTDKNIDREFVSNSLSEKLQKYFLKFSRNYY